MVDMFISALVSVALLLQAATGVNSFTVSTNNADVKVKENIGTDLTCTHSGDFGSDARVEWKFNDPKGSQVYVVYDGQPTEPYSSRVTTFGNTLRFGTVTRRDTGIYICEVSGNGKYGSVEVKLTVQVPPSAPLCRVPSSVTTDKSARLTCYDDAGSPPSKYKWYKNGVLLPPEPNKNANFKNATYKLNVETGTLEFPRTIKADTGLYVCEAYNDFGPPQRCKGGKMEVRDLNTGGIVAGVIVILLLVALLIFGLWYAHKKGYLPKKTESKPKSSVMYQPPSLYGGEDDDGDFKQKSSFVV